MDAAFAEVGGNPPPDSRLDQAGLVDGSSIVIDYIEHGELGLAFDHVIYMIVEPPIRISPACFNLVSDLGKSLRVNPKHWQSADPTRLFGSLPSGWTIERVRTETPLVGATLLPLDTPTFDTGATDLFVIEPVVIIVCDSSDRSYVLVQDQQLLEWHMGMKDGDEVLCWASCGTNLAAAIRML